MVFNILISPRKKLSAFTVYYCFIFTKPFFIIQASRFPLEGDDFYSGFLSQLVFYVQFRILLLFRIHIYFG